MVCICYFNHEISGFVQELKKAQLASPRATDKVKTPKSVTNTSCNTAWPKQDHCCQTNAAEIRGQTSIGVQHSRHAFKSEYSNTPRPDLDLPSRRKKMKISADISVEVKPDSPAPAIVNENLRLKEAARTETPRIVSVRSLPREQSEYKDFSAVFVETEEVKELGSGLDSISRSVETLPHLKSGGTPRAGRPDRPATVNWRTAKTKLALVVPKKIAPKQDAPSKAVSLKAVSLKTAAPKAKSLGNQKIRDAPRDSVGNILPMKMSYKDFSALFAEAEEARELESGLETIFQDMETLPHLKSGGNPGARRPGSPGRPSKANWQTAKTKLTLVVTPKTAPPKPTLLETTPPKAMSPKAVTPKATPPKLSQKSVYAAPPVTDKPCKDDVTSAWDRLREHVVADADVRGYMYVPPLKNPPVIEEVLHKVLSVSSGTMSSTSSGSDKMTKSAISKRKSLVQQAKKKGKNFKKTISKVFSSKMEVKDSRVELIDSSIRLEKFEINRRTMSAWYKNRKSVQEFAQISKSKSRSSTILTSSEGACKSAKAGDTDGSISTDFKLVAEGDLKPISKFKEMKNKVKQLLKMKKPKDVASTSKKKSEKEISVSASEIPLTMSEVPLTTSEIIRSDIAAINKTQSKALAMKADKIPSDVPIRFISVHERKQTMDTEMRNADLKGSVGVSMKHEGSLTPISSSKSSDEKVSVMCVKKVKSEAIKDDVSVPVSTSEIPLTMSEIPLTLSEIIRRDIEAINKTQRKALAMKVDEIQSDVPIRFMSVHERRQTMDIELEKADLKGSVGVSMEHEGSLTPIISRKSCDEKVSVVSVRKVKSEAIKEDVSVPVTIIGNPPAPASSKTQWIQSPPAPTSGKAEATILVADEIPPEVPINFSSVKKIQMQIEQVKAAIEVKQTARQRLMEKMPELNLSSEQEISSLVAQKRTVMDKHFASKRRGSMSPDILEQVKCISIPSAINTTQGCVSKMRKDMEDKLLSETKNVASEVLKNVECQKVKKTARQRLMEKMPELNLTYENEFSAPVVIRHSPSLTSGKTIADKPVLVGDTIPPEVPINLSSVKERKKQMGQENACLEVTSAVVIDHEARKQSLADLNELLRVSSTRVTANDLLRVSHSTVAANEILRVLSSRITPDDLSRVSSSTSMPPAKENIFRSVTPKRTEKTVPMTVYMATDANIVPLVDRGTHAPPPVSIKSQGAQVLVVDDIPPVVPINFSSVKQRQQTMEQEKAKGYGAARTMNQTAISSVIEKSLKMEKLGKKQSLTNQILSALNLPISGNNTSDDDTKKVSVAQMEKPLHSKRRGSITPDVLEQIHCLSLKPGNERKKISHDKNRRKIEEKMVSSKLLASEAVEKTAKKRLQEKMPHLNFSSEDDTPSCHDEELQDPVHQEMGKERLDSERRGSVTPDILEQIRRLSIKPGKKQSLTNQILSALDLPISGNNTSDEDQMSQVSGTQKQDQMLSVSGDTLLVQLSGKIIPEDDTIKVSVAHIEKPLDSKRRGSITPDVLEQIHRLSLNSPKERKKISHDKNRREMEERMVSSKLLASEAVEKTAKQRLQEKMPHLNFSSEDDTPSCHDEELQDPVHHEMGKENGYATFSSIKQLAKDVKRSVRQLQQETILDVASGDESGSLCSEISAPAFVPPEPTSGKTKAEMTFLLADEISPEAPIGFISIEELQKKLEREKAGGGEMIKKLNQTAFSSVEKKRFDMEDQDLVNRSVTSGEKTSDKEINQTAVKQKRDQMLSVLGHKLPQLSGKVIVEDDAKEISVAQKRVAMEKRLYPERRGSVTPDVLEQIRRLSIKPDNETKTISVNIKQINIGERLELKPINSKEIKKTAKQRLQEKMPHLNFSSDEETAVSHAGEPPVPVEEEAEKAQGFALVPPEPTSENTKAERAFLVADEIPPEAPIGFVSIKQLQEKLEREKASRHGMIKRISQTAFSSVEKKRLDMEELANRSVTSGEKTSDKEISQAAVKQKRDQMLSVLGHKLPQFSGKVIVKDDTKEVSVAQKRRAMEKRLDSERRGSVTPDVLKQIRRVSKKPANKTKSSSVDIKRRDKEERLELKTSNEIQKTAKQRLQEKMPHLNFSSDEETSLSHDGEPQLPVQQGAKKAQGFALVPLEPTSETTKAERTFLVADEIPPEAPIGFRSIKQLQDNLERERASRHGMTKRMSQTAFSSVEKKRLDMEGLVNKSVTPENTPDKEISQAAVKEKRDQMLSVLGHKLPQLSGKVIAEDETKEVSVAQNRGAMEKRLDSERRGSATHDVLKQIRRLSNKPANNDTLMVQFSGKIITKDGTKKVSVAQREKPLDSERRGSITPDVLEQINRLSLKPANETKEIPHGKNRRKMEERMVSSKLLASEAVEKTAKQCLQKKMPHLDFSSEDDTASCHDEELQDPVHQDMGNQRLDSERRGSVTPDVLKQIKRLSIKPANKTKSSPVDKKRRNKEERLELKTSKLTEKNAKQRLQEKMPHLNVSSGEETSLSHDGEPPLPVQQGAEKAQGFALLPPEPTSETTKAARTFLVTDEIPPKAPIGFLSIKQLQGNLEQERSSRHEMIKRMSQTVFSSVKKKRLDMEELANRSVTSGENTSDKEMSQAAVKQKRDQMLSVLGHKLPQLSGKVIAEDDTQEVSVAQKRRAMEKRLDSERRGSVTPDVLEQIRRLSIKPASKTKSVSVDIKRRDKEERLELKTSKEIEKTAKQRLQEKMPHLNFSSDEETLVSHDGVPQVPVQQSAEKFQSFALLPPEPTSETTKAEKTFLVADEIPPEAPIGFRSIKQLQENLERERASRHGMTKRMSQTAFSSVEKKRLDMEELVNKSVTRENTPDKEISQAAVKQKRDQMLSVLGHKLPQLSGKMNAEDDTKEVSVAQKRRAMEKRLDSERRGSVTPDVLEQIRRLSIKPANETKSVSVDIKQRNIGERLELKPINSKELEKTAKQRLQEKMPHLNFSSKDEISVSHDEELQVPEQQEAEKAQGSTFVPPAPKSGKTKAERTFLVADEIPPEATIGFLSIKQLQDKLERERASGHGMIKRISQTAFSSVEKKRLDMEELVNRSVTSGENTSDKEMSQAAVKQKRDQMLSVLGHKLPQLSGKVIAEDDTKEVSVAQKRRANAMEKRLDSERRGSVTSDVLEQIRRLSIKPANETKSVSVDIKQRNIGELKPINSKEIEKTAKQRLQEKMPHLNFSSEDDTSVRHDKELQVPVQKEAEKTQGFTFGPPAPKSGKTKAERTFLVADEIPPEDHIGFLSIKDLQEKLERERAAGRGMKKRISQTTFSSVEQKRLEMEELAKRLHTSEENTSDEEMSQVAVKHKRIQMKLMSVLGAKLPISGQALAEDEIKHVSVKQKRLVMQSCSASHRRGSLTPDLLLAIKNFSKIKESETKNVSVAQKSKAMQDCSASHRRGSLTPDLLLAINNFSKIKESETKNVSVAQKSKAMQDCSASHRRGSLTPDLLLAIKNLSKIKDSETKDVSVAQQRGVMEKRLASERRCSMSPDILEQIKRMSITSAIDTTIYGSVSKRRPEMDDTLVSETKYLASEALAKVDCKNVKKTAHQRLMEKMPKLNLPLEDAISAPASIRQSSLSGKTKAAKPVLIADEIPPKVPIDFISIKERQKKLEQDSNAQRGIKKKKSQTAFPSVNDKCLQMEKRGKKQSLTKQILSALNLPFSRENASDEEMSQVSVKQKRDQMLSVLGDTQPAQFSEKVIAETDTKKVSVAEKRTAMEKRLDFERSRSITPDILEQIQRLSRKCGNVENTAKQYLQEKMSHLNFSSEDVTSASHDKELPVLGKDKSSCVSSSSVQQKSVALQPGKQLDEMPQKTARKRLLEKMPHLKLSSEKEISVEQNLSSNEKHGLLTPDILKNLRDLSVNPEALQLSYAERNGENKKMPHLNLSYEKEISVEQNLSSNEKRGLLTPDMLKNLRDLSVNPNALQLSYAERNGGNENPSACKTTSERYDSLTSVSQLNSERCGSITPDILEGIERLSIASDIQPPTVCSSSSSSDLPAPPSPNLSLLFTPEGSLYSDSEEEHYCEHGDLFSDEDEMEPPAPLTPRTVAKANVDDPPDHWLQLTLSRMLTPEMDPPSPPELTPSTSFCKFDSEDLPPMPCVEESKLVKKTSRTGKSPLKKSLKEVSLDLEMRLMAPPPEIVADSISQARSRYSSVRLKSEAAVAGKEPTVVVVGSVNDKKKTMEHFIMKGFAKSKKHGGKGENPNKKDDSSPESSPRGSSNLKLRTSSRQYSECSGAVQCCESCGRIYEDCRDEKNKKKRRKRCLSCCSSSAAENP